MIRLFNLKENFMVITSTCMSTFGSFLVGNKINEKITCLFFIFQAHLCLDTDMSSISTLALGLKLKRFSSFFLCTDDYG